MIAELTTQPAKKRIIVESISIDFRERTSTAEYNSVVLVCDFSSVYYELLSAFKSASDRASTSALSSWKASPCSPR